MAMAMAASANSIASNKFSFTNGNNANGWPGGQGPLFEKHEIVGKGAYGAVYRGVNRQTGQVVALKIIDLDHPANDDLLEIQKEVAILASLRDAAAHNCTLYYGCWIHEHELWIAMDYASGGSVRTLMKAGDLEERYIVLITREVLIALAYLHKEGIIHRDIKAANILLTQAGRIMLADFGVAAHLAGHSKRSTFIGTPYWMAPEVITEGKMYDTKADLWSTGITVYEMAMGNPPLMTYSQIEVLHWIPRRAPPKLEVKDEREWSQNMKEFMELCLTIEPSQRPTADELSKSKWIKGASKVPTSLLKELIIRYGGWINAGNVRTSIIGDITRRDDTFDFDTAGSWLFDDVDEEVVEALGDEPYAGTRRPPRSNNTTSKPGAGSHLAIAQMFDQDEAAPRNAFAPNAYASADDGYGGSITIPNLAADDFSAGAMTLRPGSIAIPSFDDEESGLSAFAPQMTPWYTASAAAVAFIEKEAEDFDFEEERRKDIARRQGELVDDHAQEGDPTDGDSSSGTIGLPSSADGLMSPTTVRPSWHGFGGNGSKGSGGFSGGFSGGMNFSNPNPFPGGGLGKGGFSRRNTSEDDESSFGPFGGMSTQDSPPPPAVPFKARDFAKMPSPESPNNDYHGLRRSDSPDTMVTTSRLAGPSAGLSTEDDDTGFDGRTIVHSPTSPAGTPAAVSARNRAYTAPVRDGQDSGAKSHSNSFPPLPPTPSSTGKNVLSFGKKSPFAAPVQRDFQDVSTPLAGPSSRPLAQRRPTALNTADANGRAGGLAVRGGPLQGTDDNLLTPMPTVSPGSAAATPTASGFPFPKTYQDALTSSRSPKKSQSISTSTSGSFSASSSFSSTTSSSSFTSNTTALHYQSMPNSNSSLSSSTGSESSMRSAWPRGPPIRAFTYAGLKSTADVHKELERVVHELGDWLASIDTGIGQILDEVDAD